jgi:hypothetical protein
VPRPNASDGEHLSRGRLPLPAHSPAVLAPGYFLTTQRTGGFENILGLALLARAEVTAEEATSLTRYPQNSLHSTCFLSIVKEEVGGWAMEKDERGEHRLVSTDGEIEEEMLGQIAVRAIPSMAKENERLIDTLIFLEDALSFGGIDKWMWVGSVIYTLTDNARRKEFMKRIPPENNLHDSGPEIKKFGRYLSHWRKHQIVCEQHPIQDAIRILTDRLTENAQLLERRL